MIKSTKKRIEVVICNLLAVTVSGFVNFLPVKKLSFINKSIV